MNQKNDVSADTHQTIEPSEVPRMSRDELKSMLNDPALVLIDVRKDDDWNASQTKIKGAVRESGDKVVAWAANYPKDRTLVLYCA